MISIEQHFSLNRLLLLAVGIWPYQQSKLVRLQSLFFSGTLITAAVVQVSPLFTAKCTSDFVIKLFSSTSFFLLFLTKYVAFNVNMKFVKELLAQTEHTYNQLKDKNEYAIVEKYGNIAKCYTAVLATCGIFGTSLFIITQYWTSILDIILPINESRPFHVQIITEYFIDQQKYFFLITLHITTAYCIGIITLTATGTILVAFVQHFCGMFRLASYRIERMMKIIILENNNPKSKNLILDEITCAVDIHRQAMKLTELISSKFEVMLGCLIFIGVISLSLNLFRISQIVSSDKTNIKEMIWPFTLTTACILYMFVANYMGQDIIDINNYLFVTVYNVPWYIIPLNVQKIILFLLQRGTKEYVVGVGGLFVGSLECFATLVKASVSYFTVIHSTR
ncbi:odorant receptor 13a-like [Linepithema humile]|uniref:odorant receptor 13a-like n=1 Tax=Linepithema humile TaxID=83485 RepID=UPI00351DF1FD